MSETLLPDGTSSIGAVWPPEHTTHNRLRGFYTDAVVRTADDIAAFETHFREGQEKLDANGIDRLSIRFVTTAGNLALLDSRGITVEAAIPLASVKEPDLLIAYAGHNVGNRALTTPYLDQHRTLLQEATTRRASSTARSQQQALAPKLLDHDSSDALRASMVPRFLDLYAAFNYDKTDVTTLLTNPANTIAYLTNDDGDVISTAMLEEASIKVAGLESLTIAELTEASTRPDCRGQGLYEAVSGYLTRTALEQRATPLHALYSEGNLAEPGVVYAAHRNGRRLSCNDAARFNISRPEFGILPQNFCVAGGTEQRPYNDFAVSYARLG